MAVYNTDRHTAESGHYAEALVGHAGHLPRWMGPVGGATQKTARFIKTGKVKSMGWPPSVI